MLPSVCGDSLESAAALGELLTLVEEYLSVTQAILDEARAADPATTSAKTTPLLPLLKVGPTSAAGSDSLSYASLCISCSPPLPCPLACHR